MLCKHCAQKTFAWLPGARECTFHSEVKKNYSLKNVVLVKKNHSVKYLVVYIVSVPCSPPLLMSCGGGGLAVTPQPTISHPITALWVASSQFRARVRRCEIARASLTAALPVRHSIDMGLSVCGYSNTCTRLAKTSQCMQVKAQRESECERERALIKQLAQHQGVHCVHRRQGGKVPPCTPPRKAGGYTGLASLAPFQVKKNRLDSLYNRN